MMRIDPSEPLTDQIRTSEDEQNERGGADIFYDAEADRLFTVEHLSDDIEQIEIGYYWPDETESVPVEEFCTRLETGRYGRVERNLGMRKNEAFREFIVAAFDELVKERDIDEEFEPLGLTFRDLRYIILIHYGPDIRTDGQ